jgi:hypothetical protein
LPCYGVLKKQITASSRHNPSVRVPDPYHGTETRALTPGLVGK